MNFFFFGRRIATIFLQMSFKIVKSFVYFENRDPKAKSQNFKSAPKTRTIETNVKKQQTTVKPHFGWITGLVGTA